VKRQDIEVLIDEPLGKGAFGRVYRRLLQSKIVHKLPGRVLPDQMTSKKNCVVAVKMLKG